MVRYDTSLDQGLSPMSPLQPITVLESLPIDIILRQLVKDIISQKM